MAKSNLYADWLKAEQTNINNAPAIVSRPATTVGNNPSYADLMLRNEQIRNSPETTAPGAISQYQTNQFSGYSTIPAAGVTGQNNLGYADIPTADPNAVYSEVEIPRLASNGTGDVKPGEGTGAQSEDGYAKYLAMHPEYAEADRRAEAEYARSLPTYGALAEQMAQAGIHGGYSDYLQGVAYAKMQDAKQQNEEAARAGYAALVANGGASNGLYDMLAQGSYEDADGNLVQGYNLLALSDADYEAYKPTIKSILTESGKYTPAQIEEAFAGVERTRATTANSNKAQASDLLTRYGNKTATEDEILTAFGFDPESVKDKTEAVRFALDSAVEDGIITAEQRSKALKNNLPIYSDDLNNKGWQSAGEDYYKSVASAVEDAQAGRISQDDLNGVIDDALTKMGVKTITYNVRQGGANPDLVIKLGNGITLKADDNGKASDDVKTALNREYPNLFLAVYEDKLYYKYKGEWHKLKTKTGSRGTPDAGDQYFGAIAQIMMAQKDSYQKPFAGGGNTEYDIRTGKAIASN